MTKLIHAIILTFAATAIAAPGQPTINPLNIQSLLDQIFTAQPDDSKPAGKPSMSTAASELMNAESNPKALPTNAEQLARLQQNAAGKGGITGLSTLGEAQAPAADQVNTAGVSTAGTNPVGSDPVGSNLLGSDTAGANPAGVNPAGMSAPAGMPASMIQAPAAIAKAP